METHQFLSVPQDALNCISGFLKISDVLALDRAMHERRQCHPSNGGYPVPRGWSNKPFWKAHDYLEIPAFAASRYYDVDIPLLGWRAPYFATNPGPFISEILTGVLGWTLGKLWKGASLSYERLKMKVEEMRPAYADLGEEMTAHFDPVLNRWVFEGGQEDRLNTQPLALPPTTMEETTQMERDTPIDPLAALMAPPQRNLNRNVLPSLVPPTAIAGSFAMAANPLAR